MQKRGKKMYAIIRRKATGKELVLSEFLKGNPTSWEYIETVAAKACYAIAVEPSEVQRWHADTKSMISKAIRSADLEEGEEILLCKMKISDVNQGLIFCAIETLRQEPSKQNPVRGE